MPPIPVHCSPRGRSSVGRASASQAEGRGFEPHRPLRRDPCRSEDAGGSSVIRWTNWISTARGPGARALQDASSVHRDTGCSRAHCGTAMESGRPWFLTVVFDVTALTFNAVWQYARRHRLIGGTLDEAGAAAIGRRFQLALIWLTTGARWRARRSRSSASPSSSPSTRTTGCPSEGRALAHAASRDGARRDNLASRTCGERQSGETERRGRVSFETRRGRSPPFSLLRGASRRRR